MVLSNSLSRLGVLLLIAVVLNATLMPGMAASKEPNCEFDKKDSSCVHARKVFGNGDYRSSKSESNAFIKSKNTSFDNRAAAPVLFVAMIKEDLDRPAEEPAEEQVKKPRPLTNDSSVTKQSVTEAQAWVLESQSGGKPWYKKWWAMILGVGVVAAVAVVAGGGGSGEENELSDELPAPPDRPSGK